MVVTVWLFVLQTWRGDSIFYSTENTVWCCESKLGRLRIGMWDDAAAPIAWHIFSDGWVIESIGTRSFRRFKWSFAYDSASNGFYVWIPLWFLFLIFAIKPTWSLIAWRRRVRRLRKHLCIKCGYDLQGNPDAESCPECGVGVERREPGLSGRPSEP
jgi:hypothetical protein